MSAMWQWAAARWLRVPEESQWVIAEHGTLDNLTGPGPHRGQTLDR